MDGSKKIQTQKMMQDTDKHGATSALGLFAVLPGGAGTVAGTLSG